LKQIQWIIATGATARYLGLEAESRMPGWVSQPVLPVTDFSIRGKCGNCWREETQRPRKLPTLQAYAEGLYDSKEKCSQGIPGHAEESNEHS